MLNRDASSAQVSAKVRREPGAPCMNPEQFPKLTDPSYISEKMLDKVIREKFQENENDDEVRDQAIKLIGMLRASQCRPQVIVDVLHAASVSGNSSPERVAEVGFAMGLQFGFELALSYPPLR